MSKILKLAFATMFVAAFAFASTASANGTWTLNANLKRGSVSDSVKSLQQFLNACPDTALQVTAGSTGSSGYESRSFGALTEAAVKVWQGKVGLPQTGRFWTMSNEKASTIGNVCGGGTTTLPQGCTSTSGYSPITGQLCSSGTVTTLPLGCTSTSGYSSITGQLCSGGSGTVISGPVSAMLAIDNPSAGYVTQTQAGATLLKITFTGTGTVTNLQLQKMGVAADASYSNIYLYDGSMRLTDGGSISNNGAVTFANPAGLFTVSGSKTISVKVDFNATASEVVGLALNSYTVSGSTAATSAVLSGNIMTVLSSTGLSAIAMGGSTLPSAGTIDPQNDYVVWQNTITVSNRDAKLWSLALHEVGSINYTDVNNFRLMIDGATVATTQSIDANGYVTLVPATPINLMTGSRVFKVMADIVGGANRNFKFEVRNKVDLAVTDAQSGYGISASGTFANAAGIQTLNQGNITVQKATDSPSGDVIYNGTDIVLARYTLRTFGEAVKIDNIKASVTLSAGTGGLRSGRILINGQQVGSTATLAEDSAATPYTTYTTNYTLAAGSTATLEIRADLYETGASAVVAAAVTAVANLEDVGTMNNAQGVNSGQTFDLPTSDVLGNTLTVRAGTVTVAKQSTYTDQTTTAPKTSYKIGSWTIVGGTVEDVNMDTFSYALTLADAFDASDLNNVMMKVDGAQVGSTKATVTSPFSFNGNVSVPKGMTKVVELYADILTSATDGDGTADTVQATLTATGTTSPSGSAVTPSAAAGQTTTVSTGTFATALDGSSPVNTAVSGNQDITAAAYKFTATNETYTLKEIQVKVSSSTVASVISSVQLYDGATPIGSPTAFSGATGLVTGLNVSVPANTVKVITAHLMLGGVGTSMGTSQVNAALTLDSVKYSDSQGVETTDGTDRAGNEIYVYKAVPTFTQIPVDTTTKLVNGTQRDLFKFTVTAPSSAVSANGITIKNIRLPVTWNDGGAAGDALEVESMKVLVDGSDITSSDVTVQDQAGNTAESTSGLTEADTYAVISWDAGKEFSVGAGQTRTITLRGTFQGFNSVDATTTPTDSVGFNLLADTAHNSTKTYLNGVSGATTVWGLHTAAAATGSGTNYAVIWSDVSANPHATAENASSSGDWANSYKIFNDMNISQFND